MPRKAALIVFALVLVATLPGNGAWARPNACLSSIKGERAVRFRASDGAQLRGVTLGAGRVGVLLGNSYGGDTCDWTDASPQFVRRLETSRYRVLLFDYRGTGDSPALKAAPDRYDADVLGAVAELRHLGARREVLVGSSLSGIVMLAAAPQLQPAPSGIVSLSGSGFAGTNSGPLYGNLDGKAAVGKLRVPLLLFAAKRDAEAVSDARILFAASASPNKLLVLLPGRAHGTELVNNGARTAATVTKQILAFLRNSAR